MPVGAVTTKSTDFDQAVKTQTVKDGFVCNADGKPAKSQEEAWGVSFILDDETVATLSIADLKAVSVKHQWERDKLP